MEKDVDLKRREKPTSILRDRIQTKKVVVTSVNAAERYG